MMAQINPILQSSSNSMLVSGSFTSKFAFFTHKFYSIVSSNYEQHSLEYLSYNTYHKLILRTCEDIFQKS